MSYDIGVHCHCCGSDLIRGSGNMTSNVSGVWNKAGAPLRDWDSKTASEVLPRLQSAIDQLGNLLPYERTEYDALVRGGGEWGTFDSAAKFLADIRDACCRDPQATLSVSH